MAVLGNIKQVISIAISAVIFRDANASFAGFSHMFGMILALGGGFLYSLVEVGTFGNSKDYTFGASKDDLSGNLKEDIGSRKTVYTLHELRPRHFLEVKRWRIGVSRLTIICCGLILTFTALLFWGSFLLV